MFRSEGRAALVAAALILTACGGTPQGAATRVIVPRGASFSEATDSLANAHLIGWPRLFRLYGRASVRKDGNSAVIAALGGAGGEMRTFVRRYIESPAGIDLKSVLSVYGLQLLPGGVRTHVQIADSLSREQRDLLHQLGYNEKVERDRRIARPR